MDPAVVGKFKMTPVVSSMASELKKAAEANDSVSRPTRVPGEVERFNPLPVGCFFFFVNEKFESPRFRMYNMPPVYLLTVQWTVECCVRRPSRLVCFRSEETSEPFFLCSFIMMLQ